MHWNQNHFIVLYKISYSLFPKKRRYKIADPGHGVVTLSEEAFKKSWLADNQKGIALFLAPTKAFYELHPPAASKLGFKHLWHYLLPYKLRLLQMSVLLLFGSAFMFILPFLTQWLIDKGVMPKDLNMVFMLLLAQLCLVIGNMAAGLLRNWITLVMGARISITIISDFLKKLLRLSLKFFETKTIGDLRQRINDNDRIEEFLTSQSLITFFSIISFSVFFAALCYYNWLILFVYLLLTVASVLWSLYWLRKRKIVDYYRFQQRSESQDSIYEILHGVDEMKLNAFETFKINKWEDIQQKLFAVNRRILKLDQMQFSGFELLSQIKNIAVTFLSAAYAIDGTMTLGELLSVSYIIGQMNSPVNQLIDFFSSLQLAKLSMERLNEVGSLPEEEQPNLGDLPLASTEKDRGIRLRDVCFQYEGPHSPFALKDINLTIPEGKITAIVGASGSGKTTLVKLLLKFYPPVSGEIYYNGKSTLELSPKNLRKHCGVVMQDGFIFSDTIERNIVCGEETIDKIRLDNAIETANLTEFITALPLGLHTKVGASGNGLSGGQRQRILIARAVYKNPHYIFFDEATSSLDAENEKIIHDNLQFFFQGKTVLIVAHRLSTVKNAHQIIVLKNAEMIEKGTHRDLVSAKGAYYHLIKNQLELGD